MKICLILVALALVSMGCRTVSSTTEVNTPNGYSRTTVTKGPYDTSTNTVVNSKEQYDACMRQNVSMGDPARDFYCRGQTTGGVGAMPGYGYGPGGMVMPGQRGAILLPDMTTPGAVAMENSSGGARVYVFPGSQLPGPAASGQSSSQDVEDLARATKANRDAICRTNPKDPMCCTSCRK